MKIKYILIITLLVLSCNLLKKNRNKEIDIKENNKFRCFNIYNFNFSNFKLYNEDPQNYILVYGKLNNWDSILFCHIKCNRIEKIVSLGSKLYKLSYLNKEYKSQKYVDTVYSNLKDSVIYFRDVYNLHSGNYLRTIIRLTTSSNSDAEVVYFLDEITVREPIKVMLQKLHNKAYRPGNRNINKSINTDTCLSIETSFSGMGLDSLIYIDRNCIENTIWGSYWSKYGYGKKGLPE